MSRYLITIRSDADREKASRWAAHAKEGMRVEFKEAKRSSQQNDKLWAMLTEVAAQVQWHGIKLTPEDFKFIFLDALKRELRMVPNIDGTGFVNLGRSSSDLSKSEMSDLIEIIHAFGAGHGVVFKDTEARRDSALTDKTGPTAPKASDQEPSADSSGEVQDRMDVSTSPTNSNSVEPEAPQAQAQPDEPADPVVPPPVSAGDISQPSAPANVDEEAQVSEASPAGLPSGWGLLYAAALRRAQRKESLAKYASAFWAERGGWEAHKGTEDGATAAAIFDVFKDNFSNKEQIEMLLREII